MIKYQITTPQQHENRMILVEITYQNTETKNQKQKTVPRMSTAKGTRTKCKERTNLNTK